MKKILDGIVNKDIYNSVGNRKILWILKEGNVDPNDIEKERNICDEFNNDEHLHNALGIPTFRKIIYASYWLNNLDKEWETIPFANEQCCYDAFKGIAYININKFPATNVSSDKFLYRCFEENETELLNQINEINPEIIICGGTFRFIKESIHKIGWDVSDKIREDDNTDFYITKNKGIIISAFHPAYVAVENYDYAFGIRNAFMKYLEQK